MPPLLRYIEQIPRSQPTLVPSRGVVPKPRILALMRQDPFVGGLIVVASFVVVPLQPHFCIKNFGINGTRIVLLSLVTSIMPRIRVTLAIRRCRRGCSGWK